MSRYIQNLSNSVSVCNVGFRFCFLWRPGWLHKRSTHVLSCIWCTATVVLTELAWFCLTHMYYLGFICASSSVNSLMEYVLFASVVECLINDWSIWPWMRWRLVVLACRPTASLSYEYVSLIQISLSFCNSRLIIIIIIHKVLLLALHTCPGRHYKKA